MTDASPADRIRRFAAFLAGTDIAQLEWRTADSVLRVRRDGAAPLSHAELSPAEPSTATQDVTAPSLGVFLHQHPMHEMPLAPVGVVVARGQTLGFLRIGLLLLAVTAPHGGAVAEVVAADGETVGYGATLLRLWPGSGWE